MKTHNVINPDVKELWLIFAFNFDFFRDSISNITVYVNKDRDIFLSDLKNKISNVNQDTFDAVAKEVFDFQRYNNPVFRDFVGKLDAFLGEYIFLPISAFKTHKVKSGLWKEEAVFESSGTTGMLSSTHHVRNTKFYLDNALKIFQSKFGHVSNFCVLALLPNYLEKGNSSLVAMVDHFIRKSNHESSGFFLYDHDSLSNQINFNEENEIKTLLFGVSFALLDFVDKHPIRSYKNLHIMETGGMKGRRKEITRHELHQALSGGFKDAIISSEYGMTELLSQAYLDEDGWFYPGNTMKILISEINDPLKLERVGKAGVINIIDLANVDTCSFITTEDIGVLNENGGFEVLGRLDDADLRGCNLMISDRL